MRISKWALLTVGQVAAWTLFSVFSVGDFAESGKFPWYLPLEVFATFAPIGLTGFLWGRETI